MDRKVLAVFLIILIGACLVMGCAGRRNEATATPSIAPTAAPSLAASATAQASAVPGQATAIPATASVSVNPSATTSGSSGSGVSGLDPSLISTSGEGQDEGGMPDDGLPTPTLD